MKRFIVPMMIAVLLLAVDSATVLSQPKSGREKLGLRIGYVESRDNIDKIFGDGSSVTLHFTERIKVPLFIEISLGALYLGKANVDSVQALLSSAYIGDANMRLLYLSASPILEIPVMESSTFYISGGFGLYSISVLLDRVFYGFDTSQQHLGALGSAGVYYTISDNWKLNSHFSAHYVWTTEEATDMFFFYSEGDSDPLFYEFSVGASYSMN
ncbi:MAG: hypothetical protein ABIA59_05415 [Candidatus Latescibacterota bacterium]